MVFGVLFLPCFPLYFEFPPMKNEKRIKALLGGGYMVFTVIAGGLSPEELLPQPLKHRPMR